jgi:hypothetical protein
MFRVFGVWGSISMLPALEKKVRGWKESTGGGRPARRRRAAGRGSGCRRLGQVPGGGATSERLGEGKSLGFGGLSFCPAKGAPQRLAGRLWRRTG